MAVPIVVVDAFADRPFGGNPAAVCVLERPADEEWMRNVAREMNLSETAFCHPEGDGWRLRWLTPTVEVDLCGHATVATTHVLATEHAVAGPVTYRTRSGELSAEAVDGVVTLDFPSDPPTPAEPPAGLLDALGVEHTVAIVKGKTDYLVALPSPSMVGSLDPDMTRLRSVPCRGVIATAADPEGDFDVVSRFFAPAAGVDEDPVTGSAHCTLAPFWAHRLETTRLRCLQASASGGVLDVALRGDRVEITGHAVTVLRGEIVG